MKRIAIFMTALAILATGCSKGQKFTLEGDLASAHFDPKTESLRLESDVLSEPVTIPVQDGKFSYTGRVERPAVATLKGVEGKASSKMIVLEKGVITFQDGLSCGTKQNDDASGFLRSVREIPKKHPGDRAATSEEAVQAVRKYVADHAKDPSAVLALSIARRFASPEEMVQLIESAAPAIQNDSHVQLMKVVLKNRTSRPAADSE